MIKQALSSIFLYLITLSSAYAMPAFIGDDYSGEYLCKGKNDSVGDYEVLVTLKLNHVTSHNIYGLYDFSTETNNQSTYVGQIMAKGRKFAMTFRLLGSSNNRFSTGMGDFKKTAHKRWAFHTTYYEPDGSGGNFGSDYCTINSKLTNPKSTNSESNTETPIQPSHKTQKKTSKQKQIPNKQAS